MNITNLSSSQLRKAADLKEKIAGLEKDLAALLGSSAPASTPTTKPAKKKGGMSAAGKAKIVAAQKLRWAKVKAAKAQAAKPAPAPKLATQITTKATKVVAKAVAKPAIIKPVKKKFVMSAAAKKKISDAAKARWAAKKAAKKA
jgi:hypothetical protein